MDEQYSSQFVNERCKSILTTPPISNTHHQHTLTHPLTHPLSRPSRKPSAKPPTMKQRNPPNGSSKNLPSATAFNPPHATAKAPAPRNSSRPSTPPQHACPQAAKEAYQPSKPSYNCNGSSESSKMTFGKAAATTHTPRARPSESTACGDRSSSSRPDPRSRGARDLP